MKLLFSSICFLIPIAVKGTVIEVCTSCVISSVEIALQEAEPYDTIEIAHGVYVVENLVIDKPMSVIGQGSPELHSKSGDEILTIISDSVSIIGLTLKYVTTSYLKERSAVRVKKHDHFIIKGNRIIDCFFGIYLENAKHGKILDNVISGNATTEAESGNGVHAWYCDDIYISGNSVTGQRDGIYFEFVGNSSIENNQSFKNKRYGLHFMFSNDDDYYDNVFEDNGAGVAVMFSKNINMKRNRFAFNWGRTSYGLLLKEINDADIQDNIFEQNTIGIFVEGSNRINYNYNRFVRNGWALKLSGGCSDNIFSHNDLIHNSLDLVVNTDLASNRIFSNHWTSYSGYDLNKDGIGDIPHYPVKLFSYILNQCPETIVLMRSLFVDLINLSERVSPLFTPKEVFDPTPAMNQIRWSK